MRSIQAIVNKQLIDHQKIKTKRTPFHMKYPTDKIGIFFRSPPRSKRNECSHLIMLKIIRLTLKIINMQRLLFFLSKFELYSSREILNLLSTKLIFLLLSFCVLFVYLATFFFGVHSSFESIEISTAQININLFTQSVLYRIFFSWLLTTRIIITINKTPRQ